MLQKVLQKLMPKLMEKLRRARELHAAAETVDAELAMEAKEVRELAAELHEKRQRHQARKREDK